MITLRKLKNKNADRLIIAHLNINYVQNKFIFLKALVQGNIDIILISESKLDSSFPLNQFLMDGYSPPYRLDRNNHGGGLLLYIRDDIPSKQLKTIDIPIDIETIFY